MVPAWAEFTASANVAAADTVIEARFDRLLFTRFRFLQNEMD